MAPTAGGGSRARPRRTGRSRPWTPTRRTRPAASPGRPKAHVVEPDTRLTTVVKLTKDQRPGQLRRQRRRGTGRHRRNGHGGPPRGPGRLGLRHRRHAPHPARQKWTPLLKPWPIKPTVQDGFTIDDFVHDPTATVTCPAGVTRQITRTRKAVFDRLPRCRCVHDATANKAARSRLHPHGTADVAADEGFQTTYRQRPGRTLHRLAHPRRPPRAASQPPPTPHHRTHRQDQTWS